MLEPIQAASVIEGRAKSGTELARVVGAHHGWQLDEEDHRVYAADGAFIASTLEDLAAAMETLAWFAERGMGVVWAAIPHVTAAPAAADAVRAVLEDDGTYASR